MVNPLRVGDRVVIAIPTPRPPARARVGTVIELRNYNALAVVRWDDRDYLGFQVSTKTVDVLRKVAS